jgi:site-specific DNA-cytosine methylase
MSRGKGKSVPKGQMSITSFVEGAKVKETINEEESDVETSGPATNNKSTGIHTSHLPPIHHIPSIFADIVSRIPKIQDVAKHLQGRKLRVATMCSGTESPLLALDLICRSIKERYNIRLDIEHVFSCEIEPFKQAYIERNFRPPILFRDVCELGDTHAYASLILSMYSKFYGILRTTAYGALVEVPGQVDLLVAGTSCVDYSNLNNEKQDIDAEGESGRTFRGMMSWVKNHRPPIVILENVCSAPWDRVIQYFKKNGYSASQTRLDTKNYYIPHTRMRGYLVAVDNRHSDIPDQWLDLVPKLKRPASSTLDAFLLPSDDPRIHQAREKLVRESYNGPDRRTGRIDWGRCESRHQRARVEEELGSKRPLTGWDEGLFQSIDLANYLSCGLAGGSCKVQDFAWGDWATGQVERVWDLMDISLLRSAIKGVDPSYKTFVKSSFVLVL